MNILEFKEFILNNFNDFCDEIKNKFNVVGLSFDMLEVDEEDEYICINIEDDAELVEKMFLCLTPDESTVECNINGLIFYVYYFYDAMD